MSMMSPELALVDPELRADAVARLPPIYVNSFLEFPPFQASAPVERTPAFRPSVALTYLVLSIARTLAFDAIVFAAVAVLVLLVSLLT
jgi:hypothetical protein